MQYLPINQVRKNLDNPRIIKDHEFKKLCKSIKDNKNFFESRPLILTFEKVIVAGNQRFEAARVNGMKTVPVHILPEDISQEELDSIMLLDNRHNGYWDWDKLSSGYDFDVLKEDFGFTEKELGLEENIRMVFDDNFNTTLPKEDVTEKGVEYDRRKELEEEANRIAKERYNNEKAKIERETREQVMSDIKTGSVKVTVDMLPKGMKDEIIEELKKEQINKAKKDVKEFNDTKIEISKKEPLVKYGDIFEIECNGLLHRVMCGDSVKEDDVKMLMNGNNAEILFTSPPYSDMRKYKGNKDLSINNLSKFIKTYYPYTSYQVVNLGLQFKESEVIQYWNEYLDEAKETGYKLLAWNVWHKTMSGNISSATNMFSLVHEWLFVFGKERKRLNRNVPNDIEGYIKRHGIGVVLGVSKNSTSRDENDNSINTSSKTYTHHQLHSVNDIMYETGNIRSLHPATYPIKLPLEYINAMTNENDIVIDSFLGSGTTLLACQEANRNCYGMELDERYTEVILRRYTNYMKDSPYKVTCINRQLSIDDIIKNI